MLSNPRVVVEEMPVLGLGLELGLVCELVELSVVVAVLALGTDSELVLALPLLQAVMAQVAGVHRLQTQDGLGLDRRVLHLEQLAVASRQDSFGLEQLVESLYSSRLVAAPHSSSFDPCHDSKDVLVVRSSGPSLQGEARSVCLVLVEEALGEEY